MAESKVEKDWRVADIEGLKKRVGRFRKIALILMPIGIFLFVSLFFLPFKVGFFGTILWFVISLGLSASWYLSHSFKIVKAWEMGVVFRKGKILHEVYPGWQFLFWPLDMIIFVQMYDVKFDPPDQDVFTMETIDNTEKGVDKQMPATLDLVFWGRVIDPTRSITEVENLKDSVLKLTLGIAREVVSKKNFENVSKDKDSVAKEIESSTNKLINGWGYEILKTQIQNVKPSPELLKAQESIQVANKKREAARIDAEIRAEIMAILDKADPGMEKRLIQALEGFKGSINIVGSNVLEILRNMIGGLKR